MSDQKENPEVPFYELPAHIKPCSRIIQETRLQLSHKGKLPRTAGIGKVHGSGGQGDGIAPGFHSRLFSSESRQDQDGQEYVDSPLDNRLSYSPRGGLTGIRPVYTQRPMTAKDDDIWGISSRKRPPSAITLSRLSLGDLEEEPSSGTSSVPSLLRKASTDSGKPTKIRPRNLEPNSQGGFAEEKLMRTSIGRSANVTSGERTETPLDECKGEIHNVPPSGGIHSVRAPERLRSKENEAADGTDGLLSAVNYLNSVVNHSNGLTEERPLKSQVIAALQQVKGNVGEINECPSEVRHRLLKLIFKLVEWNQHDEDMVFWASFVLLHCKIMGNNLSTVFKMVFKASRSQEYWTIIQETEYLDVFMESFGQICPLTQTESMIYGYGTLKFICMEKRVLTRIVQLSLVPIMTLHLKLLNYELSKGNKKRGDHNQGNLKIVKPPETIFNGVFQLTSILRKVVEERASILSVVTSGLLEELCNSLEWTVEDIDILSNVVRILSVLSGDPLSSQVIASNQTFIQSAVTVIKLWHSKEDVVVRLTYALGNLLAHCESLRIRLYEEPSCYNMILHLINYYLERTGAIAEDILIKTIRILANWSLNTMIGHDICEDPQISHLLSSILTNKGFSDELLICVISTLNNITFYKDYSNTDLQAVQMAESLFEYLTWTNVEGRREVMKVLGNLTRNPDIREMAAEHVDKFLLSLAEDGQDEELMCATVGVLMNIIVESRASEEFLTSQGTQNLIRLMRARSDLVLNLMICQFLWNVQISNEKLREENCEVSSGVGANPISIAQRLEISDLIRFKLENLNLSQTPKSTGETPFPDNQLDLETEFRSVAERLFDKLMDAKYLVVA